MDETSKAIPIRSKLLFFYWGAWFSIFVPIITSAIVLIIFSKLHFTLGTNEAYMSQNYLSSNILGIAFIFFVASLFVGLASFVGFSCHKKTIMAGLALLG